MPRYSGEYLPTFQDRLADFLLEMAGLAGRTQGVLAQQEAGEESRQNNLLTTLARLQEQEEARGLRERQAKDLEYDREVKRQERQAQTQLQTDQRDAIMQLLPEDIRAKLTPQQ